MNISRLTGPSRNPVQLAGLAPRLALVPVLAVFVLPFVVGGAFALLGHSSSGQHVITVGFTRVFPVVFAATSITLVASFFRRRHLRSLSRQMRGAYRFSATMLTIMGLFGYQHGWWLLGVSALARLLMAVPTKVAADTVGPEGAAAGDGSSEPVETTTQA